MATSSDLLSQPSNMSSIQPSLFHYVKLECPNDLVHLFSDSSKGDISNVSLKIPTIHIPISNSKYSKHSKSVFIPIGLFGHSNLSCLPFHPNIQECPSVMQCLRSLASIPGSRNKLASIDYDKIAYHKVQYLPPMYKTLFPLNWDNIRILGVFLA